MRPKCVQPYRCSYVLDGQITLISGSGETLLDAGMCVGLPAGGAADKLINRSKYVSVYLEGWRWLRQHAGKPLSRSRRTRTIRMDVVSSFRKRKCRRDGRLFDCPDRLGGCDAGIFTEPANCSCHNQCRCDLVSPCRHPETTRCRNLATTYDDDDLATGV